MADQTLDYNPADTPKRTRTRLAKAELWMSLASTVHGWAESIADLPGCGTRPFAEWDDNHDDPFHDLARRYGLTPTDLARIVTAIAGQLETRAMDTGYERAWL